MQKCKCCQQENCNYANFFWRRWLAYICTRAFVCQFAKLHLTCIALLQIVAAMTDLLSPEQVEKLAAENGRTIPQVCKLADVAPSTFSRWKAGKTAPSIDIYKKLRDAALLPPDLMPTPSEAAE